MAKSIQEMTIRSILKYLDNQLDSGEKVNIKSLAVYSGYSSRHIQRLFKDKTGMTAGEYVRRRRVTRAAWLVRLTTRPLSEIGFSMGFDSQQTFSREFKKYIGYTPTEYRFYAQMNLFSLTPLVSDYKTEVMEVEKIFLEKSQIRSDELISWGTVPCTRASDSFCKTLDIIFTAVSHTSESERICVMSRIESTCHNEYTHKIISYLENKNGNRITFTEPGWYIHIAFYTNRENHMMNIYTVYMDVLKKHNAVFVNNINIEYFHKQNGEIICDLYIPVDKNQTEEQMHSTVLQNSSEYVKQ